MFFSVIFFWYFNFHHWFQNCRFGQKYIDRVANPKDIVHFFRRKLQQTSEKNASKQGDCFRDAKLSRKRVWRRWLMLYRVINIPFVSHDFKLSNSNYWVCLIFEDLNHLLISESKFIQSLDFQCIDNRHPIKFSFFIPIFFTIFLSNINEFVSISSPPLHYIHSI